MDHSLRSYLERQSTEKLKKALVDYQDDKLDVPVETVLMILEILTKREPSHADVNAAYERFKKNYLNEIDLKGNGSGE